MLALSPRTHARRCRIKTDTRQGPSERVANAGLPARGIGENIAAGNATADETHTQWMNSSGHRRNILSADYTRIGIGYATCPNGYRHYWTQVFAR